MFLLVFGVLCCALRMCVFFATINLKHFPTHSCVCPLPKSYVPWDENFASSRYFLVKHRFPAVIISSESQKKTNFLLILAVVFGLGCPSFHLPCRFGFRRKWIVSSPCAESQEPRQHSCLMTRMFTRFCLRKCKKKKKFSLGFIYKPWVESNLRGWIVGRIKEPNAKLLQK